MDAEGRKRAFDVLRAKMWTDIEEKYTAALDGTTLPPMIELLPTMHDISALEFASTGKFDQTHERMAAMGKHARTLMQTEIRRTQKRIAVLEDLANSNNSTYNAERRGLFSTEQNELKNMIQYLQQIERTARDARSRARSLGFDGAAWEPIIADAGDAANYAQAVLNYAK
jgi:predicted TIM-barrel fold metal-dependent hydrolase